MSKRFLSTKGKILIDAALCLGSYVAALVIGIGAIPDATAARPLLLAAPAIACARILSFQAFSVYRAAWRYMSVLDALAIAEGALPVTLLWLVGRLLAPAASPLFAVPLSVIALEFLLVLVGTFGVRAADRLRYEWPDTPRADNVLVIGAGDGAERFISDWGRKVRPGIHIVAIVDDHPAAPRAILGVPMLGDTSRIPELVAKLRIDEAVITVPDMPPEDERRIMSLFTGSRARVSRLPGRIEPMYDDAGPAPVPPPDIDAMAREQLALFKTLTGREYDSVSEATYPVANQYEVNKPFSYPDEDGAGVLMQPSVVRVMREHGTLEKGLGRRYLVRALFDSGFERATVLTAQGQYRTWVVARKPCPGVAAARSVHYASDFANALWQYEET